MKGQNLKEMVHSHGTAAVCARLHELMTRTKEGHVEIRPEDISIRELWEALVGPVGETLEMAARTGRAGVFHVQEAPVDSTAFADLMGVTLANKVIEAYEAPGYIGDGLCTTVPSKQKDERYPGFTAIDNLKDIDEGMPYEDVGFLSKYVTSEAMKKGRTLPITEEAVYFDQTGQLLLRAARIGDAARATKEQAQLNAIQDTALTVWSPLGVAEPLYRVAGTATSPTINRIAVNALVDWTDINNALQIFAAMVDEANNPIVVPRPLTLLVPEALAAVGGRIVNATELRTGLTTATETALWVNPYVGIALKSSVYLDAQSATRWYLGNFTKQFAWQEVWPLQVLRAAPAAGTDGWKRDVVVIFKVRYFGGMTALDDKYVVSNS